MKNYCSSQNSAFKHVHINNNNNNNNNETKRATAHMLHVERVVT